MRLPLADVLRSKELDRALSPLLIDDLDIFSVELDLRGNGGRSPLGLGLGLDRPSPDPDLPNGSLSLEDDL